jgi:hypothetical protein
MGDMFGRWVPDEWIMPYSAIKSVLDGGRLRADVITAARKADPSGALANHLGGDVLRWLSDRAAKSAAQPVETRGTPSFEPNDRTFARSQEEWRRRYFGDAA